MLHGYQILAECFTEAVTAISNADIRAQLQKAIRDITPEMYTVAPPCCSYESPWLTDIFGDDQSGELVYSLGSYFYQCSYTVTNDANGRGTKLGSPVQVLPRTVYDRAAGTQAGIAVLERKLKAPEEKQPGFSLTEQAAFVGKITVKEAAKSNYTVKVIAPGWGSSAYYPKEVLERDGPKVFKAGTHMYWNHATPAEEAARPEGDLNNLAGVFVGNAYFDESGKEGPGLYAPVKVFSDYAKQVEEKGPHIGVSIRAAGIAKEGTAEGKKGPILQKFTYGLSTDFVTLPGAGGAVLQESAPIVAPNSQEVPSMTEAELKALQESNTKLAESNAGLLAEMRKIRERAAFSEAREQIRTALTGLTLHEATKARIVDTLVSRAPLTESGDLDAEKLKPMIEAAVKDEAAYLANISESGKVRGMGAPAPADEASVKESQARLDESLKRLGVGKKEAA